MLKNWLDYRIPGLRSLNCEITADGATVIFSCSSAHLPAASQILEQAAVELVTIGLKSLDLYCEDEHICHISLSRLIDYRTTYPQALLLERLQSLPGAWAIACQQTHQCLYSSAELNHQSMAQQGWAGLDLRHWHIPEDFARYTGDLESHRSLAEYQYKALNFSCEPVLLTVDAWLSAHQGRLIRIVKTLNVQHA